LNLNIIKKAVVKAMAKIVKRQSAIY
jgi:hypothetical protein